MQQPIIRKTVFLKTTREEVWDFLTEPDKMAIWFHRPDTRFFEGAEFAMTKAEDGSCFMSGKVLEALAPERLVYEFTLPQMRGRISVVSWAIADVPGGVELSLNHTDLPQGEGMFDLLLALDKGWEEHIAQMRESFSALQVA